MITGLGQAVAPERPSAQVKLTVPSVLSQPFAFGVGLMEALTVGAVLSTFSVRLVEAVLPARSAAVPLMACCAPSLLTVRGPGQLATPQAASVQVKLTVTAVLCQPAAFGPGDVVAEIVGASLSV